MRILVLNQYFPPDTSATAYMAAAVVDKLAEGHNVTVLCGRPSYDPTERHPYYLYRRDRLGMVLVGLLCSFAMVFIYIILGFGLLFVGCLVAISR